MKFCCDAFSRVADGVPRRAFAVFVEEYEGKPVFYLQFRSIDRETSLPRRPSPDYMIIAAETRLIYCPWCGKNLAKFYKKQWPELRETTKDLSIDLDNHRWAD